VRRWITSSSTAPTPPRITDLNNLPLKKQAEFASDRYSAIPGFFDAADDGQAARRAAVGQPSIAGCPQGVRISPQWLALVESRWFSSQ
jgi:hypothetical protein